jgi:iron complex transport system permease protein
VIAFPHTKKNRISAADTGIGAGAVLKSNNNKGFILLICLLILVGLFFLSFFIGRFTLSPAELLQVFWVKIIHGPPTWSNMVETIIFKIRLPRILAAMLIGAALSIAGATYQGLFKNPMVSPDILGCSAGASFGAALALLLSCNAVGVQISAFTFGIAAVALSYTISKAVGNGEDEILMLVLVGMVVMALFQAFISITKYVADPYSKLPAITFWLMGGLTTISLKDVQILVLPVLLGTVPLLLLRWKLNALSFGDEEAQSMGINTSRIRLIMILCATLITSAAVSVGGQISWVGLVIPHLSRLIVGQNNKVVLPASVLIGAAYLLFIDDLARSLFVMEIPLGILTSLIGAPFFIFLLLRRKKRKWV